MPKFNLTRATTIFSDFNTSCASVFMLEADDVRKYALKYFELLVGS